MAKLIKLTDRTSYDANHIIGIIANHNDSLDVMLSDGSLVSADRGYGESVWKAKQRLEDEINAAKANGGA
ncbi:hypothetical protein [Serratia fonticola]|jgi:hypothetical protein|uniref:Uncharacterized protein n=1 Tax=Serratia fonticola TaxID=47917 RepID=A0AAW3WYV2_SERFO|nr:hypothetical protein [Serratia fonticola]MBC3215651.1 hypothetical protein [Serratia fonticola]NYA10905.1 hypothetical protein [Serratia fonticola]NYA32883.1 hypothetical protein [Serratia fonticola]